MNTPQFFLEALDAFNKVVVETGCYIGSDDDGGLFLISLGDVSWDGPRIFFQRHPGEVAHYVAD